jgi:tRNA nucleotidyltransferase/poly(A) polymerase
VTILHEAGHVAYFAGGCVRDMLLGQEPSDFDVATDAHPRRVGELFHNTRLVGEAFGVVLVRLLGREVEVATFRREWGYADGRHPDHIQFTDARHDALRRDFTINGMFFDPLAGQVLDFVGGQADLQAKLIRAIGDPAERFAEDYLRMLRAVRFAARLGFPIEPQTAEAITRHVDKLGQISRERIGMEMQAMMARPSRAAAVELLEQFGLDAPILQETASAGKRPVLGALPDPTDYPTSLAAWLIDRHAHSPCNPDAAEAAATVMQIKRVRIVRRWRKALVLSNEQKAAVRDRLAGLCALLEWSALGVAERKRLLARNDWPALEHLLAAIIDGWAIEDFDRDRFEAEVAALRRQGVSPEPLINGDDLIAQGFKPGPVFKPLLDQLYDAQLEGRITTRDQAVALAGKLNQQLGRQYGSAR